MSDEQEHAAAVAAAVVIAMSMPLVISGELFDILRAVLAPFEDMASAALAPLSGVPVAILIVGAVGAPLALPLLLRFVDEAVNLGAAVGDQKVYPITTVDVVRRVEREKDCSTSCEAPECLTCGVTSMKFVTTEWRRERVVFGFVVDVLDAGEHHDCRACASDPHLAALRAAADDPHDVDELSVEPVDSLALDDLDDEQLDAALSLIDRTDRPVTEAIEEVA